MRKGSVWHVTLTYVVLGVSSFIMIYPVLYMVLGAFTTEERLYDTVFLPIPNTFSWARLVRTWAGVADAYGVTLVRVGFYLAVTLLVGLIGGYIFSKLRFPG